MIVKKAFIVILLFNFFQIANCNVQVDDLLQNKHSVEELKQLLVTDESWVPYPAYSDREGWDILTEGVKNEMIAGGEKYLDYEWQVVKFSDYTAFESTGSREVMEQPFGENNSAMSALVLAELAEGKGRFIDQIINGTWFACEMTSWVLSAHLAAFQTSKNVVPDPNEYTIDLAAGDLDSFYS